MGFNNRGGRKETSKLVTRRKYYVICTYEFCISKFIGLVQVDLDEISPDDMLVNELFAISKRFDSEAFKITTMPRWGLKSNNHDKVLFHVQSCELNEKNGRDRGDMRFTRDS